jgi:hypothetical protein
VFATLIHGMLAFSLLFTQHGFNSRLQLSVHNYISISHISLLSPRQHPYFRLNHFRIYFVDNELKNKLNNIIIKITIHTNLKYDT